MKHGPDFMCLSCHRLMYRQTVKPLNKLKYAKASQSLLADVFSTDHFLYTMIVVGGYDAALTCGKMPVQAVVKVTGYS